VADVPARITLRSSFLRGCRLPKREQQDTRRIDAEIGNVLRKFILYLMFNKSKNDGTQQWFCIPFIVHPPEGWTKNLLNKWVKTCHHDNKVSGTPMRSLPQC
jgi:hypothetical protein